MLQEWFVLQPVSWPGAGPRSPAGLGSCDGWREALGQHSPASAPGPRSTAEGLQILDTTPKSCFRGKARHRLNTQPRGPGDCHLSREETRSLELQQGPVSLLPADLRC